jgi:hypothetical protein
MSIDVTLSIDEAIQQIGPAVALQTGGCRGFWKGNLHIV